MTAAAIFKKAGIRLHHLYKRYGAKLVIPLHDSFIFEAPKGVFEEVCELTRQVMIQTLQEQFPVLAPKVEINATPGTCWTKDGHHTALAGLGI